VEAPLIELVSLVITTACNRRCPSCSFQPITRDRRSWGPEHFKKIAPIIGHVHTLYVTGGEPLMHPQFEAVVDEVVRSFSYDKLQLATNGDLLGRHEAAARRFDVLRLPVLTAKTYPGCPDNSEGRQVARRIGKALWERPTVHWERPGLSPLDCTNARVTTIVVGDAVYPCCMPIGPGIPLKLGWREAVATARLPCDECVLASAADVARVVARP